MSQHRPAPTTRRNATRYNAFPSHLQRRSSVAANREQHHFPWKIWASQVKRSNTHRRFGNLDRLVSSYPAPTTAAADNAKCLIRKMTAQPGRPWSFLRGRP